MSLSVQAILEAGIPIDRVAGVSIGALMGALWCQERDVGKLTVKARSFSAKMSQKWRMVLDLTYPYTRNVPFRSCLTDQQFVISGALEQNYIKKIGFKVQC